MSKTVQVGLDGISQESILKGAEEYGLSVNRSSHSFSIAGQYKSEGFSVAADGIVTGDFYGLRKLGNESITQSSETQIKDEVMGRLGQAGNTMLLSEYLEQSDYTVETNSIGGTLVAEKAGQTLTFEVGRDGCINSDAAGFEGDACSIDLNGALDHLGSYSLIEQEDKNENAKAIRNVV